MHKNNFYISFGVWLIILSLMGIPGVWKNNLMLASGIFLVLVSMAPILLKKLQTKPKMKKRQVKIDAPADIADSASTQDGDLRFSAPADSSEPEDYTKSKTEKQI